MKSSEQSGRQKRNTAVLAAVLLAVFLAGYLVQRRILPDSGLTAVVQADGKTVRRMDLDRDAEYMSGDAQTGFNIIEVRGGAVRVREADCRNQICVETGEIRNPGEVITCLPHALIVYIEEDAKEHAGQGDGQR